MKLFFKFIIALIAFFFVLKGLEMALVLVGSPFYIHLVAGIIGALCLCAAFVFIVIKLFK